MSKKQRIIIVLDEDAYNNDLHIAAARELSTFLSESGYEIASIKVENVPSTVTVHET